MGARNGLGGLHRRLEMLAVLGADEALVRNGLGVVCIAVATG